MCIATVILSDGHDDQIYELTGSVLLNAESQAKEMTKSLDTVVYICFIEQKNWQD